MSTSNLRHDIQGMRGISILAVVLYHAFPFILPGGFVGVDVFFVVSGFVITGSILRDDESGRFSVVNFYRRRIRRIFPALYVMLAVVILAALFVMPPAQLFEAAKSAVATIFFSSNYFFMKRIGYFDGPAALRPLLHTWSLAVEEQFYILFPLLLVLVCRKFPRFLRPMILAAAALSLLLSIWLVRTNATEAFFSAPPRAFELLFGALVACPGWKSNLSQKSRDALSVLGLVAIAVPLFAFRESTPFPGLAALLPCCGAALLIRAGVGTGARSLAGEWLSTPILAFLGSVSYSLYLWHWPILVGMRFLAGGELRPIQLLPALGLALLASYASLICVERPFLDPRRNGFPFLSVGLASMATASVLCILPVMGHGLPQRFSASSLALFSAASDANPRRSACHYEGKRQYAYQENCLFGASGVSPDVAVFGDSHGAELVVAIGERLQLQGRAVMQITASACPPALRFRSRVTSNCASFVDSMLSGLIADAHIRTVVLCADFAAYQGSEQLTLMNGYTDVVQKLRSSGKRVIAVYPIPVYSFDPPTVLGIRHEFGLSIDRVGMNRMDFDRSNRPAIAFLDSLKADHLIDTFSPEELLCDANRCRVYSPAAGPLYFNPHHLSIKGARILAAALPL